MSHTEYLVKIFSHNIWSYTIVTKCRMSHLSGVDPGFSKGGGGGGGGGNGMCGRISHGCGKGEGAMEDACVNLYFCVI